ncbi:MAG: signal peptidase II [Coxiella endosymbiont of Haemaphysalis qinghaiensis]
MKATEKKALPWLWLSFFIIMVDQWTKYLAVHHLVFAHPIKIFPWLNLTLSCNTGAAFSFLNTEGGWQVYFFALISLVVSIFLTVWLGRIQRSDKWGSIGLSLIIGGALGNFIDRIRFGYVIDFIDFHIKNWHYATFNAADSAIFMAALLLIIAILFAPRPS